MGKVYDQLDERLRLPGEDRWDELAARFPARRGAGAVVVVHVERIADSCGFAVPLYQYAGERDLLDQWTKRKDDGTIAAYRAQRNSTSIDDLPALPMAAGDPQAGQAEPRVTSSRRYNDGRSDVERRGTARAPMAARLPNLAVLVPATSFGELLRAHRERALLSQEKLAKRAGLSARTIRELEAGRVRRPRGTSVQLLAQALKLQGSLRQAFEAAARTHPSAQTGDAVPRAADEGCRSPPLGGGGVLSLPPPSEVSASGIHASVLSLCDWLTAASSAVPTPNAMSDQAVGLRLDGQPAGLRGSRVVAVAAELAVGRSGRCWACGRQETG